MNVRIAETDEQIAASYSVMRELRAHIAENEFVPRLKVKRGQGYGLAFVEMKTKPVAVAGFRISENLAWGRFLYVDDLVTLPEYRSRGYGSVLLHWLESHAIKQGCKQIHLDSGLQRTDAHRFYKRKAMEATGYHFAKDLTV